MSSEVPVLVSGQIILDGTRSFSGVTVYVRLEDVTRVGAPSVTVAEQVIPEVSYRAGSRQEVAFDLTGREPDPRARYNVRVHVDVDDDGRISQGDYLSTQSYPVLTDGHPDQVTVYVSRVG
jgi:uncharacterized lipoprotein YbaY